MIQVFLNVLFDFFCSTLVYGIHVLCRTDSFLLQCMNISQITQFTVDRHLSYFWFGPVMNNAPINILLRVFCRTYVCWVYTLEWNWWVRAYVYYIQVYKVAPNCLPIYTSSSCVWEFHFLNIIYLSTWSCQFLMLAILVDICHYCNMALICIFLFPTEVDPFFLYLLVIKMLSVNHVF